MSEWHPACEECVMDGDECLLQENNDVESCQDVREYDLEGLEND